MALALLAAPGRASDPEAAPPAGVEGGAGLALVASKALTAALEGPQVIDGAVLLLRDGRIEAVGALGALQIPDGYETLDVRPSWVMPGMIDLHTHIGGSRDINDMVFQANPGLRVSSAVVPENDNLLRVLSAGVTTVLFIPGSGTNVGGQGILLKTGLERFEDMRIRDPGSLKIAQGDNPTRFAYGMGRSMMNYHIRNTLRRGLAYARSFRAAQENGGSPERNIQFDVFRDLEAKRTQVSTHTQAYQLVLTSITMLRGEFGLDVYIDHGEWEGFKTAALAEEMGVGAIIGPREVDTPRGRSQTDGRILGVAAGYQAGGHSSVGFNTDAPVVPGEELPLQAAMGVRYGFENRRMEAVRGLTIVPAMTAGIADRVGSLEPGKDADVVVTGGDPADPRSAVEMVLIEGRRVYDARGRLRRW